MAETDKEDLGELKDWEREQVWLARVRASQEHVEESQQALIEAKRHLKAVVRTARKAKVPNKSIADALGRSEGRASQIGKY